MDPTDCRILLIEDDPACRAVVRRLIATQQQGIALHEAPDLHEGLRLIAEDGYTLILLDHTLPDGTALDDLRQVRTQHPDVPVVLHTGFLSPDDHAEALAQGAQGIVIKGPFAHLWAAIQRVCPQLREPRIPRAADAPGATVLVVEDDQAVRGMVERTLREEGYGVVVADHGRHALDLLDALPDAVDLVFADIRMPQMSGPELGRILAERQPGLPIIYTSGWPEEQERHETMPPVAAAGFLAKPFAPPTLVAMVHRVLAQARRPLPPA